MSKAEKVREYFKLVETLKDIEARKAELAEEFKAEGTFSTKEFNVVVEIRNRTALKGLDAVAEVVGLDFLNAKGLVQTSQFKTVRVLKKGA